MSEIGIRRLGSTGDLAGAAELLIRFFREEKFDTPDHVIRRNTASMAGLDNCGLYIAESSGKAIGVATISRWERGRLLQNRAMDNYLRLLAQSSDNIRFLEGLRLDTTGAPTP